MQDFLLKQMDYIGAGSVSGGNGDATSMVSMQKRRGLVGKHNAPMTAEELKLNKQILMEINKKKKEKMGSI